MGEVLLRRGQGTSRGSGWQPWRVLVLWPLIAALNSTAALPEVRWTARGPFCGRALSLAAGPSGQTMYLTAPGRGGRLFVSRDAGASWRETGPQLERADTTRVAIDSDDPDRLFYAAWGDGLFASSDGGATWRSLQDVLPFEYVTDPHTIPGAVFVSAWGDGVFRSTDGGDSWTDVSPPTGLVYQLTVHPTEPARLFVITAQDGIFYSDDRGENWRSDNDGLPDYDGLSFNDLTPDPATAGQAYVTWYDWLFRSQQTGGWQKVGRMPLNPASMLALPGRPGPLVLGSYRDGDPTGVGALISYDGGATWPVETLIGENVVGLSYVERGGMRLFARTDSGLLLSRDGQKWSRPSRGINAARITALLPLADDPEMILAGMDECQRGRIARSVDGGRSWITSDSTAGGLLSASLAEVPLSNEGRVLFASGLGAVVRSVDDGRTWTLHRLPRYSGWVRMLTPHPREPRVLFAATSRVGLARSDDFGRSWTVNLTDYPYDDLGAVVIARDDLNRIVIGSRDSGIARSLDGGATWTEVLEYGAIQTLVAHPRDDATLFAVKVGGEDKVLRSDDGGATWTVSSNGLPVDLGAVSSLAIHPWDPRKMVAGTLEGVYVSTDGGRSWQRSEDALAGQEISAVAIGNDGMVHAGNSDQDLYMGRGVFSSGNLFADLQVSDTCHGITRDLQLERPPDETLAYYEACDSLTAGGDFTIAEGTEVVLRAGEVIRLVDGFSVESGGLLTAASGLD